MAKLAFRFRDWGASLVFSPQKEVFLIHLKRDNKSAWIVLDIYSWSSFNLDNNPSVVDISILFLQIRLTEANSLAWDHKTSKH